MSRGGQPRHLLTIFLALFFSGVIVLGSEFLHSRKALAETRLSHDTLRKALLAGNSVAWDLDVKTGEDRWFGDLRTMFGISADTFTVKQGDFYRRVHPDDVARVSEAVAQAHKSRSPYTCEFRIVREDGIVRWVRASGEFQFNTKGEPMRMLGIAIDITERRLAEQARDQSEEKFSKAFHHSPVGMILTSIRDHRYVDVNHAFEQCSGWQRDEVVGRTPYDLNIWVDPKHREDIVKNTVAGASARDVEVHFRRKNGGLGIGLSSTELIQIAGESCMLSAIVDITDRKRAEEALRTKDAELAEAQSLAHLGNWEVIFEKESDVESGKFNLRWSEEMYRIHGLDPSQGMPQNPGELFTPESWQQLHSAILSAPKTGSVPDLDLEVVRPDGSTRWVNTMGEVRRDSSGRIISLRGTTQDITDRKHTEEVLRLTECDLRESEKKFRRVVEHIRDAVIADDLNGRIVFANDRFLELFGFRREQLSNLGMENYIAAECRDELIDRHHRRLRGENVPDHFEYEGLRADGTRLWLEVDVMAVVDQDGKIVGTQSAIRDITERKRTQQLIHDSEVRFRRVVEHIGDALLVYDVDGRAIFANDRFFQLFGFRREQLPSLQIGDLVAPEYRAGLSDRHDRRMRGEPATNNFELEGIRVDGSRMWLEVNVVPTVDQDGQITGAQSVMRDITERKQAQRAIHDSEERLRHMIESSNDWVYEMDQTGAYTYAGPQCRELLGYEPEELVGKKPFEFMPAEEADRIEESFRNSLTEPKSFSRLKTTRLHKDGRTVVWETNGVPIFGKNGEFRGYRGMVRDITERHRAEEQLRESEDRFRRVVAHIADALIVDDVRGHVVFANDRFLNLFGFRRDELENLALEDYVAPESQAELRDRHYRRMSGEELTSTYDFQGICRDGTRLWIDAEVVGIKDSAGKVIGAQRLLRDRTAQKRAELALRESEERFRLVANTAPVMIWTSGTDKLCDYFNRPWLDFTGRPLETELGYGWVDGVHPEDVSGCVQTYNEAFDLNKSFEMQYRLLRHDGEYRWILDFGVPRFNQDGSFAGYIGSCIDITERKQAEEEMATIGRRLIEAQEQERTWIGRELHDDINQRLALASVELDRWIKNTPSKELSDPIQHVQQRIMEIAKDVQSLSHRLHSSKLEYLGLARAASSFCKELSEQSNVRVTFRHEDVPGKLPEEISLSLFRVLQESLQNAVKHSGQRSFTVQLLGGPESLELTVADTGNGFDPDEALASKGLGLISMRERLEMIHGEFSIRSKPGTGTTVHARVPLPKPASEALAG